MKTVVIMPGGFHPFHAGHYALYQQAKKAFPGAEVYVAATDDRSTRPFPFEIKEKLAKLAGVDAGHFVRVTSPFQAREITANFDPAQDRVIFVRSEKDANEPPRPGGVKKDGSPSYLQPYTGRDMEPFGRHAYMAYLPTVEFGPGLTSATQIRAAWPGLNDRRKTALVMSLYPKTQGNPKLAATVVKMLDTVIAGQVNEISFFKVKAPVQDQSKDAEPKLGYQHLFKPKQQPAPQPKVYQGWDEYKKEKEDPDYIEEKCWDTHRQAGMKKKGDRMVPNCVPKESQLDEKWSEKYKRSINCANPKGFSQRAHCQGRKK